MTIAKVVHINISALNALVWIKVLKVLEFSSMVIVISKDMSKLNIANSTQTTLLRMSQEIFANSVMAKSG